MKMIIVYNNLIPFKGFHATTLFPFVFVRKDEGKLLPSAEYHERIHLRQQAEMIVIFFYLWYCIEFLVRLILKRNRIEAYRAISFEKEAKANMYCWNQSYLENRKFWGFLRYL